MFSLWSCFQKRYADTDLKTQASTVPPEARQSLAEKIVQTLDENGGIDGDSEKVEEMLAQVEKDLEQANQQLKSLEEKEEFISVRIAKYQLLLKQQDERLLQMQKQQQEQQQEQEQPSHRQRYQEQLDKQQANKEALGKVLDVHLGILRNVKESKRTVAVLEQKKYDLKQMTKKCRQFLITAEEVEREQHLGITEANNSSHNLPLAAEMVPLNTATDAATDGNNDKESDKEPALLVDEEAAQACDGQNSDAKPLCSDDGISANTSTTAGGIADENRETDAEVTSSKLEVPVGEGDEKCFNQEPELVEPKEISDP